MATLAQTAAVTAVNPIRRALDIIRAELGAYITLNIVYYGLIVMGMIYVTFYNPGLQQTLLKSVGQAFSTGPLSALGGAYDGGLVLSAILLTFAVNLVLGSMIEISLPALIIPFSGLVVGLFRALLWGLLLAPAAPGLAGPMIPHSVTLLIEGQAYILVMLAAYIQGKAFLWPEAYGRVGHRHGYAEGLRRSGWIYVLVTITLAVAAIYEALEVIYLAPLLR